MMAEQRPAARTPLQRMHTHEQLHVRIYGEKN